MDALHLQLGAFEGPLDLLLALARAQKVDLADISILALTDQYLAYLAAHAPPDLEIAADYLVMAAWLAYLKSCLLLPPDPNVDPSPEQQAALLQQRLMRLDAMREAGARLMARDRLGRDVFGRGAPEGLSVVRASRWQVTALDLYRSYGRVQARTAPVLHVVQPRAVVTLEDAIARVAALVGEALDWTVIDRFLAPGLDRALRRSALASTFAAALELARQGTLELRQQTPFAPLELRGAA